MYVLSTPGTQLTTYRRFCVMQVIITAQLIFGTTVIDYDWPTSALSRELITATAPSGLAIYYGDEVRLHFAGTLSAECESPGQSTSSDPVHVHLYRCC